MKHYNIAFCGLGSIGKRHIKNVSTFLAQRGETFTIDLYRSSLEKELPADISPLVASSYLYDEKIDNSKQYDVVFVTNPTSIHLDTLLKFKEHTQAFFIEKPIFDTTNIDKSIFSELQGIDSYVACPLRYCSVLMYVKQYIALQDVFSVRAVSSSYLPDWRPGQDYRKCYSAHRNMGGGVGIDLIHEWDYLVWLFGMPTECYSIQGKISNLEIDSDDIAVYIARKEKTAIELHLDYFGRSCIRTLELYMPEDTIRCDIEHGKIEYLKSGKTIQFESERNECQMREIDHFFRIINHEIMNDSTAEHAFDVLELAKGEPK